MIKRRSVVGLSLLSALLLCAFATQSASAALTTSKNTTAFTCVKDSEKKGDFTDAHCDTLGTIGKSDYKHTLIKVGETTNVDSTNNEVTESTKKSEPAVIKGEVSGGGKMEIECATVKNNTTTSWIRNAEPEKGQHTLEGFVETEFSKCNVKLLKNCTVEEPIISKANFHGVEGLEGPKGEKNAMGGEFIGAGENETFAEISFIGELCSVKTPTKFPVKGKVIGTNGPTTESPQEAQGAGATVVYTPKFKMQELTMSGKPAEFSLIGTATMSGGGNPITATTTT